MKWEKLKIQKATKEEQQLVFKKATTTARWSMNLEQETRKGWRSKNEMTMNVLNTHTQFLRCWCDVDKWNEWQTNDVIKLKWSLKTDTLMKTRLFVTRKTACNKLNKKYLDLKSFDRIEKVLNLQNLDFKIENYDFQSIDRRCQLRTCSDG